MEKTQPKKDDLEAPFEKATSASAQDLDGDFGIEESVLHDVLYGVWPEWGGQRPPEHARQKLLKTLPEGAVQSIPAEVFFDASTLPFQGLGIFATSTIVESTVIGPLPGQILDSSKDDPTNIGQVIAVVDANSRTQKAKLEYDWMSYIRFARNYQEQNLETFLSRGAIYYRAIKDIPVGNELLVWLGFHVHQHLGIPYDESIDTKKEQESETDALATADKKKISCVVCQKGFNSRSNLRSHMRTHTLQKPFKCHVCHRRFSQSSTLRNHTRLHTGEKPYKCSTCNSSYSQLAGLRAHQKSSQHHFLITH